MGVDQLQHGTRNRFYVQPVDRPHDPGDAADLSIMGYLFPLGKIYFRR
jgi:hypothetical protein